tara:strand:+ start:76867 stop:77811 length:945 start_codon:yes stop_codon:yes gene_type:complete
MKKLNIIFAGTPEFAVPSLQALLEAGHNVIAVYTQPDRPAGRGQKLQASPVKKLAEQNSIPVYQPQTLRDDAEQQRIQALQADVMVVAAYGLILPKVILTMPKLGCLNVHASWLPRWRGAAPIQRALLAGDSETGVSIMQMAEGLDTGDVLCLQGCAVGPGDTAQILHDKLGRLGGEAIVETLEQIDNGTAVHTPQEESLVTYAVKLTKQEAVLDWSQSALDLHRAVRAYNPFPIARTQVGDKLLKIWQATPIAAQADMRPGTIVGVNDDSIDVACGEGVLRITEVQWPNKNRQSMKDALHANQHPFVEGGQLG